MVRFRLDMVLEWYVNIYSVAHPENPKRGAPNLWFSQTVGGVVLRVMYAEWVWENHIFGAPPLLGFSRCTTELSDYDIFNLLHKGGRAPWAPPYAWATDYTYRQVYIWSSSQQHCFPDYIVYEVAWNSRKTYHHICNLKQSNVALKSTFQSVLFKTHSSFLMT